LRTEVPYISNQNSGIGVLNLAKLEYVGPFVAGGRGLGVTSDDRYLVNVSDIDQISPAPTS
jgi:hypothetical protein